MPKTEKCANMREAFYMDIDDNPAISCEQEKRKGANLMVFLGGHPSFVSGGIGGRE